MSETGRMYLRVGRWWAFAILVAAGVFLFFRGAEATPTTQELKTLCSGTASESQKLIWLDELCAINSTASRTALKDLADDADDRTAVRAIGALCRTDFSGARTKITGIYEDTTRSDFARMGAQIAYCRLKSKDGSSWSSIKSYVKNTAGSNSRLTDQWKALRAKLWPNEQD